MSNKMELSSHVFLFFVLFCFFLQLVSGEIRPIGLPKKYARFSGIRNIPDLLSDDKEGKIM